MKSNRSSGFTLVELLVVMVIIAILSGLLLSAIGAVRNAAMRQKGNTMAKLMASAYSDFYNRYGYWPMSPTNTYWSTSGTRSVDSNCLAMLQTEGNTNNINFLQAITTKLSTNTTGELIDPWGNVYQATVDKTNGMRGSVSPSVTGAGVLQTGVAVWSTNSSGECKTKSW